jgi:hypothetical protein
MECKRTALPQIGGLRIIYVLLGSIKGGRNDGYTFNYGCTNYYDDDYATNYQADFNYYYYRQYGTRTRAKIEDNKIKKIRLNRFG